MQPIRTPLKTELGLSASPPTTPRGMTADAARTAVPPRNALRVVRRPMAFCVISLSSIGEYVMEVDPTPLLFGRPLGLLDRGGQNIGHDPPLRRELEGYVPAAVEH